MAKILSENAAGRKHIGQPNTGAVTLEPVEVNFTAAAININDLIQLADLPPGVALVDYTVISDVLGGTPAFSIGVENSGGTDLATVYEASIAPTGSVVRCAKPDAMVASTATTRRISLKATAAATTAAGKRMMVLLHLRG
jgi:hypothetical protein